MAGKLHLNQTNSQDNSSWPSTGKKPARMLLVDSKDFDEYMIEDLITSLENTLAIICNLTGPSKLPLFGLYSLTNHMEMLLPLTHLKNNYTRVQSAIHDLRDLMRENNSIVKSSCIGLGMEEACCQFRRQVQQYNSQNNRGNSGACQQLELILITTQPKDAIQRQIEEVSRNLDLPFLAKIQVVVVDCLENDDYFRMDENSSQGSSILSTDNPVYSLLDVHAIEPTQISFHKLFSNWLLDTDTDTEHLHLLLPPKEIGDQELVIKCDVHERILNPEKLPFHEFFSVDDSTKGLSTSCRNVNSPRKRIIIRAKKLLHSNAVCESLVFGVPMILQETTCWKMDWDELESNQQTFKSLCSHLLQKEKVLLGQLEQSTEGIDNRTNSRSFKNNHNNTISPSGYFLLLPAPNGTMLIKPIASKELILPCRSSVNMFEPCSGIFTKIVTQSLSKLDVEEHYNPFDMTSGLFESLKSKCKPFAKTIQTAPKISKRKINTTFGIDNGCHQDTLSELLKRILNYFS